MRAIINKLIPVNKYNRPGTKATPKVIAVHYEGNPGATATQAAAYQMNVAKGCWPDQPKVWTSSQYVVGMVGEIIQCVPDGEVAFAASGHNNGVIHIEVCHADKTGIFTPAAIAALAELVQYLMQKYNISATNVVRHYDLTGKQCPLYYVSASRWATLKATITGANKAAATSPTTAKSTTIYKSLGVARIRATASLSGAEKGKCVKGAYYPASEIVTVGDTKWFKHLNGGYSALTDTDGAVLFEAAGTYTLK